MKRYGGEQKAGDPESLHALIMINVSGTAELEREKLARVRVNNTRVVVASLIPRCHSNRSNRSIIPPAPM